MDECAREGKRGTERDGETEAVCLKTIRSILCVLVASERWWAFVLLARF